MSRGPILNAAATGALCALLATISSGPALAQYNIDISERDTITARKAHYSISPNPSKEFSKCLYRDQIKLLCFVEFIGFRKLLKTKDYDLIAISMGQLGSGTRWWDWKLVIEDGKKATIKPLAEACLECDIHVAKLKFRSNEVDLVYRQKGHKISARFRGGDLSIRKRKLDPNEPLDEEICEQLYSGVEACKQNYPKSDPNSSSCSMGGGSNSGHFFVLRVENHYTGISSESLDRQCQVACSSGKTMDRATFFKRVCRR